ncbi:hypothetical protein HLB42_15535 [Deinococcus sp. D7000]|nr:hypothetical protein HLB42_15535 [Deinococcus sp. D7000]
MIESRILKIYEIVDQYIKFADTKAASLLSLNTALMVFIGAVFAISSLNNSSWTIYFVIASLIAVILSAISILFALTCLRPALNTSGRTSLTYFGAIASYINQDEYKKALDHIVQDEREYLQTLTDQIWSISKIANRKHLSIQSSILYLRFSLVFYTFGVLGILISRTSPS